MPHLASRRYRLVVLAAVVVGVVVLRRRPSPAPVEAVATPVEATPASDPASDPASAPSPASVARNIGPKRPSAVEPEPVVVDPDDVPGGRLPPPRR